MLKSGAARLGDIDMVFGPQTYHQLPEMIARISRGGGQVLNTEFPPELPGNSNLELPGESTSSEECQRLSFYSGRLRQILYLSARRSPIRAALNIRVQISAIIDEAE